MDKSNEYLMFKLAVDNASDHIMITDPDAHIIYANKAATETTGYPVVEMLGKTPALWGNHMPNEFYEKMWKTIKTDKQPFKGELSNKKKSGEVYQASLSIAPVLDSKGNILYFVGIERDITKEKEDERLRSEFVSLASHQLRSPMTEIKWSIESFKSEGLDRLSEKQKTYLKNINDSNQFMINLVNALLDISRLETGKMKVEPKPTSLEDLAKEIAIQVEELRKQKEVKLIIDVSGDVPRIEVDPKLISNVLLVLINNAIKYSRSGGEVLISIVREKSNIVTAVKDTGIGIPVEDQKHIFERFFRASNVADEGGGNGLGLYLAKEILLASGGKIWFESEEGKGSTFSFSLPLR